MKQCNFVLDQWGINFKSVYICNNKAEKKKSDGRLNMEFN